MPPHPCSATSACSTSTTRNEVSKAPCRVETACRLGLAAERLVLARPLGMGPGGACTPSSRLLKVCSERCVTSHAWTAPIRPTRQCTHLCGAGVDDVQWSCRGHVPASARARAPVRWPEMESQRVAACGKSPGTAPYTARTKQRTETALPPAPSHAITADIPLSEDSVARPDASQDAASTQSAAFGRGNLLRLKASATRAGPECISMAG